MPQKTLSSKAFKAQKRVSGKEFRDGVVGEALDDLYADIDAGFNALEQAAEVDAAEAGGNEAANEASIVALNAKINAILAKLRLAGIIAE